MQAQTERMQIQTAKMQAETAVMITEIKDLQEKQNQMVNE